MAAPVVRVVFIGGYARTGSTLLDRLLGQIDGFESFGELRHVWDRCFLGNQLCGCGLPFRDCPFWRQVVDRGFGGFDGIDALEVSRNKQAVDGFWNIPRIATGGWTAQYRRRLAAYTEALGSLYRAMQEVSGARYLVDSTKDPQHAYVLGSIPGFDVRMIHLVRDSRPVAYSWQRIRRRPEVVWEARDMPRYPALRTALAWDLANLAAESARSVGLPYVLVRYEDLVKDARAELRRILEELDLGEDSLAFLGASSARLAPSHSVAGNPVRFQQGKVAIRPDEDWVHRMRAPQRVAVSTLTWPLLARYGYRTGPGPAEMWRTLRLALAHRRDPLPFGRAVAGLSLRYLRDRRAGLAGTRWLDVGAGSGAFAEALAGAGASVVAIDLSDRRVPGAERTPFVVGRGEQLPFQNASFDAVASSNVIEHVPDTWRLIDELLRVCRHGGLVYLSWTNWYSPFGGHDWSPFHYLGPRLGPRAYRVVFRRTPVHMPRQTLFPVSVGPVLRGLRRRRVRLLDVSPRYWPSLRVLARIPVLREVAMWNCVVLVQKQ